MKIYHAYFLNEKKKWIIFYDRKMLAECQIYWMLIFNFEKEFINTRYPNVVITPHIVCFWGVVATPGLSYMSNCHLNVYITKDDVILRHADSFWNRPLSWTLLVRLFLSVHILWPAKVVTPSSNQNPINDHNAIRSRRHPGTSRSTSKSTACGSPS